MISADSNQSTRGPDRLFPEPLLSVMVGGVVNGTSWIRVIAE